MRSEIHVHIGRARKGLSDCLSVRDLPSGKVRYSGLVRLANATFAVQPAGLARFREQGQKNVHAFVRGDNTAEFGSVPPCFSPTDDWVEVGYNPTKDDTFKIKATGQTITSAQDVLLVGKRVFVCDWS